MHLVLRSERSAWSSIYERGSVISEWWIGEDDDKGGELGDMFVCEEKLLLV